jgi:hypothetical protein
MVYSDDLKCGAKAVADVSKQLLSIMGSNPLFLQLCIRRVVIWYPITFISISK